MVVLSVAGNSQAEYLSMVQIHISLGSNFTFVNNEESVDRRLSTRCQFGG
jgi:hypothetical protein